MDYRMQVRVIRSFMPERMRQIVMDCLREAVLQKNTEEDQLSHLKKSLEINMDGKWQIIKGRDVHSAFEQSWFPYYIELEHKCEKYIVFSKSSSIDPFKK